MALKMIESLGYQFPTATSKRKKLYAIYECPECLEPFKAMSTNVNTGNTTRCGECASRARSESRTKWDVDKILSESSKYDTRKDFKSKSPLAYSSARKQGLLDEVCAHMRCGRTFWDRESVVFEASKYSTASEFSIKQAGALCAAKRDGYWEDLKQTWEPSRFTCDNDVIYIWQIISPLTGDSNLYKVGVTSKRIGTNRIKVCARNAGVCYNIVAYEVVEDARRVESKLLEMGVRASIGNHFYGYTEVVSYTDRQLVNALSVIRDERGLSQNANGVSGYVEI